MNKSPELIILNGTLCDSFLWEGVERGLSAHPFFSGSSVVYQDMTAADSVRELALDVERRFRVPGAERWLVGFSLGGIVALELVCHLDHKPDVLVLVCTNPEGQTPERETAVSRQLQCLENGGMEAVFRDILLPAWFGNALAEHADAGRSLRDRGLRMGEDVYRRQLALLGTRKDQTGHLHRITTPSVLLCGETDRLCPPSLSQTMHQKIPGSMLHVVPDTGHLLPLLKPEAVVGALGQLVEGDKKQNPV